MRVFCELLPLLIYSWINHCDVSGKLQTGWIYVCELWTRFWTNWKMAVVVFAYHSSRPSLVWFGIACEQLHREPWKSRLLAFDCVKNGNFNILKVSYSWYRTNCLQRKKNLGWRRKESDWPLLNVIIYEFRRYLVIPWYGWSWWLLYKWRKLVSRYLRYLRHQQCWTLLILVKEKKCITKASQIHGRTI